jgi:hypothetical protein
MAKVKKQTDVKEEVRRIEARMRDAETVNRWIMTVNVPQLRKAEQLRNLAAAAVKQTRVDTVSGGYVVNAKATEALADFLAGLGPFWKEPRGKKWAAVRKMIGALGKKGK